MTSTVTPEAADRKLEAMVEEAANDALEPEHPGPSWTARIGLPLLTLGMLAVLFVGYVSVFTDLQQDRIQHKLIDEFTSAEGAVPLSGKIPLDGRATAVLKIPALGLNEVVVLGSTATDLTQGPGVLSQAARPGTIGNAVILGRVATSGAPFAKITTLKPGARILVSTGLGKFTYVVSSIGTTKPGQINPASPTKGRKLTLMTANSSTLPTGLDYVRARLISPPAVSPKPKVPPTQAELGLSGDPAAVWPSFLWSAILLAVVATTFVAYRRLHRHLATVYLLSTPIVVAIALVTFSNLYRLLPATQ
jgi:LPXTG-site transpeptidase (sortase) family protein